LWENQASICRCSSTSGRLVFVRVKLVLKPQINQHSPSRCLATNTRSTVELLQQKCLLVLCEAGCRPLPDVPAGEAVHWQRCWRPRHAGAPLLAFRFISNPARWRRLHLLYPY
jgi:hypothetical protein